MTRASDRGLTIFVLRKCQFRSVPRTIGSGGGGEGEGHEGRFSRDPLPVFSVGGPCEQFWHEHECPDLMNGRLETFIRSGQNHRARHSERGKKTRQTEEEVGRQHQGMDRPGVRQVAEGSGGREKMEETGCEVIYGAPSTLAVEG